jgi:putative transposase
MAKDRILLLEQLRKAGVDGDVDFLRDGLKMLAEAFMDLEIKYQTSAELYERSGERQSYRNGYRERIWDTRAGTVPLRIPRLRMGSYFPSLLEPRRRAERALLAVIQEAYVLGVSTRKMETLVQALGMEGISKSEVSRICGELDEEVNKWRQRPLESEYPYLWLDATYVKVVKVAW